MNQLLALFLSKCNLDYLHNGTMVFSTPMGATFFEGKRYADNVPIPRDEDSELHLLIHVDRKSSVFCEIFTSAHGVLDRSEVFNVLNANLVNIEQWAYAANTDPAKALDDISPTIREDMADIIQAKAASAA